MRNYQTQLVNAGFLHHPSSPEPLHHRHVGFGVFRSKVEVDLTYHTYLQRKLFRVGCIIKNWENLAKHPGNCWINYDSIPFRVPLWWFPMWGTNSIDVFMVKVWMSDDQTPFEIMLKSFEVRFVCFQDLRNTDSRKATWPENLQRNHEQLQRVLDGWWSECRKISSWRFKQHPDWNMLEGKHHILIHC